MLVVLQPGGVLFQCLLVEAFKTITETLAILECQDAALGGQRRRSDRPALVLFTQAILDRDAHVGQEQFREFGTACGLLDRSHFHARRLHVHQEVGDAGLLLDVRIGARQQDAVLGMLGLRRPYLLAVDHVLVADQLGLGAQRSEVGSGTRLGEALAPRRALFRHTRQVLGFLLVIRPGQQRRWNVIQRDDIHVEARRTGPCHLVGYDHQVLQRQARAAILFRPVRHGQTDLGQLGHPVALVLLVLGVILAGRFFHFIDEIRGRTHLLQPIADGGAKRHQVILLRQNFAHIGSSRTERPSLVAAAKAPATRSSCCALFSTIDWLRRERFR